MILRRRTNKSILNTFKFTVADWVFIASYSPEDNPDWQAYVHFFFFSEDLTRHCVIYTSSVDPRQILDFNMLPESGKKKIINFLKLAIDRFKRDYPNTGITLMYWIVKKDRSLTFFNPHSYQNGGK